MASYSARTELLNRPLLPLVILTLYVINLTLSVALVRWSVAGLPVRSLFQLAIFGLCARFLTSQVIEAIKREQKLLLVIGAIISIAVMVSLYNRTEITTILRQVLEVPVQAAVGLILGSTLTYTYGPKIVGRIFIIVVSVSIAFAVLQFLHIEPAWTVFDFLSRFQPREYETFYDYRKRAMGLSYTPVHLGTQICLLFACSIALICWKDRSYRCMRTLDMRIVGLWLFAFFAATISGNRSPILGLLAYAVGYCWLIRPALGAFVTIVALVMLPFTEQIMELISVTGLRIADTENSSSDGRATLQAYGTRLFLDNLLGYGVAFNSTDHWVPYWQEFRYMDNPTAITKHALHNYFLMVLNKYGVAILTLTPVIVFWMWKRLPVTLMFVPYMVHIYYHNDGPMQGDFMIWLLLPIFTAMPLMEGPFGRRQPAPPPRAAVSSPNPG